DHAPRSTEVMRILAEHAMPRGFFVPVHGVGGYEAAVAMAGTDMEVPAEAKPSLHLMALYAFERVRQLLADKPEGKRRSRRVSAKCSLGRRKGSRPGRLGRFSQWASEPSTSTPRLRCASSARSTALRLSPSHFATDYLMFETEARRH